MAATYHLETYRVMSRHSKSGDKKEGPESKVEGKAETTGSTWTLSCSPPWAGELAMALSSLCPAATIISALKGFNCGSVRLGTPNRK